MRPEAGTPSQRVFSRALCSPPVSDTARSRCDLTPERHPSAFLAPALPAVGSGYRPEPMRPGARTLPERMFTRATCSARAPDMSRGRPASQHARIRSVPAPARFANVRSRYRHRPARLDTRPYPQRSGAGALRECPFPTPRPVSSVRHTAVSATFRPRAVSQRFCFGYGHRPARLDTGPYPGCSGPGSS